MALSGETTTKIINSIKGQPDSINNFASRLLVSVAGTIDPAIQKYVNNEVTLTTSIDKTNFADLVADTPNILLEKTITPNRKRNESQSEALTRVTEQIKGLFDALDIATNGNFEDKNSTRFHEIQKKPQQLFNDLVSVAFSIEEGYIEPKLRLCQALVDSKIIEKYGLKLTETPAIVDQQSFESAARQNRDTKISNMIEAKIAQYQDDGGAKAVAAEQAIILLAKIKKNMVASLGEEVQLPAAAVEIVQKQIVASIGSQMDQFDSNNGRITHKPTQGFLRFNSIVETIKKSDNVVEMPIEAATKEIIDTIPTAVRAMVGEYQNNDGQKAIAAEQAIILLAKIKKNMVASLGEEVQLPAAAVEIVQKQIVASIGSQMDQFDSNNGRITHKPTQGFLRFNSIVETIKKSDNVVEMPIEAATKEIIDTIPTAVRAMVGEYAEATVRTKENQGRILINKIKKMAEKSLNMEQELIQKISDLLDKSLTTSLTT